ncbi:MAG: PepSY-like domain-containing protein, partial [Bacteroidetes bacterium]|nr:PepSY-like domain-containing protein [Bacteroidota bacterium]
MKTHLIAVALFVVSVNTINAQKLKETEVPKSVLTSFQTHFKGVKADEWEKEKNGEYEAEFKMNKAEMSANFSADGTLKETEQEIASSALPKAVTEYVAKNYAG